MNKKILKKYGFDTYLKYEKSPEIKKREYFDSFLSLNTKPQKPKVNYFIQEKKSKNNYFYKNNELEQNQNIEDWKISKIDFNNLEIEEENNDSKNIFEEDFIKIDIKINYRENSSLIDSQKIENLEIDKTTYFSDFLSYLKKYYFLKNSNLKEFLVKNKKFIQNVNLESENKFFEIFGDKKKYYFICELELKIKLDFVDESLIPKIPEGFETNPEYYKLCRMKLEELQNVRNFRLRNDFGEFHFLKPVNLVEVNFNESIFMKKDSFYFNQDLKELLFGENSIGIKKYLKITLFCIEKEKLIEWKKNKLYILEKFSPDEKGVYFDIKIDVENCLFEVYY